MASVEMATEWAFLIRSTWDSTALVTSDVPVTADQAWDKARRSFTLEALEAVAEVRAIPIRQMRLLTFTRDG